MDVDPDTLREDGYCKNAAVCYANDDFRRTHK